MKHKVKVPVEVTRWTIFGRRKFIEYRKVEVDEDTYQEIKRAERDRTFNSERENPFTLEEMMFYDFVDGE